ncbi:TPA: Rhophilin, Rho GTPase binding protein [Trebouxia sp. C0004]
MAAPLKNADYVDLRTPISTYVFSTYAYRASQDRGCAAFGRRAGTAQSHPVGIGQTRPASYYQSLTVLQQQFPVGRKSEGIPVEFTWYDAFQTNKRAVSNSIAYEKACVLFNLAAVCSQESLASDLTTDGGLKSSARHFQDAAGYFKLLHDVVAPQLDDVPSFDISIDSTEMLELLMLAQAQESFLQKATRDKKNPAVLARLAAQVSQYYNDIEELNSISQLRKYLGQVWTAHVHVKRNLFAAVAQQRNAEVQMADDECGNALACLQLGQWIETGEGILAYGGVDFSAYREGANPRAVMGNRPATLRYMENNYDNDTCGSGYERIWYTGQPDDPKSSQVPGYLALPGGGRAKNIKARVAVCQPVMPRANHLAGSNEGPAVRSDLVYATVPRGGGVMAMQKKKKRVASKKR